jgi:hypothetical protein
VPGVAEQPTKLTLEVVGVASERSVRNADSAVAGALDRSIPAAIGLEGVAITVVGPAVEFDDQARVAPQAVDFVAGHRDVDGRNR